MNRKTIYISWLMACEVIIAVLIAVMTTLHVNSVVSILFSISFLLPLIYFSQVIKRFPIILLIIFAISSLNVIINLLLNNGHLSFDYTKKIIMFFTFLLMVYYSCRDGAFVSQKAVTLIKYVPVIGAVEILISYFFLGNTGIMAHAIILGFSNPNAAGMWVMHFILYLILLLFDIKEKKWLIFLVPIIALLGWLLLLTQARSCLIALAFFFSMIILKCFRIIIPEWMCIIIAIFPILVVFFYFAFIDTEWANKTFSFLISEGKGLSSRVKIWSNSLDYFYKHPLLGDYYGISQGTGFSQCHNTHIDLMCSYGIIPLILYIIFISNSLKQVLNQSLSFKQYAAFSAFCSVLVVGCFEAAMVAGAMGMNLLTVGFIILAQNKPELEAYKT